MKELADWLKQELERREWNTSDLARKAEVQPASLSRIINETREAGPNICLAIAKALHVAPERVFRKAGLLPPEPEKDPTIMDAIHKMSRLTPEERKEIVRYMDFVANRHKDETVEEQAGEERKAKSRL
jgi:transcriptional regulator with XRE-family HTH domain